MREPMNSNTPGSYEISDSLKDLIATIYRSHSHAKQSLPSYETAAGFPQKLLETLFPQLATPTAKTSLSDVENKLSGILSLLETILVSIEGKLDFSVTGTLGRFEAELPEIYRLLLLDAEAIFAGDPAATSLDEVILSYPGFRAIAYHRIAHTLFKLKIPLLPRLFSEVAHSSTGIDIHPGARIGERFCIDHGTGIVIGETTSIGNNVKIYQGVTLGALSISRKSAGSKRHPTIEDNVVIYGHAIILGGKTTIGANSTIGGNVWLTKSVPANSVVYHRSTIELKSNSDANMFYI